MTTLANRTIAALRSEHDGLASTVDGLSPEQLTGPSGATEWTVAQVLSHLGSGAEITLAGFRGAIGEAPPPGPDFNQGVWDRWNALSPEKQASGAIESNAALVAAFEALTPGQRETLAVNPGFLPQAIPFASFAGMRLSEVANHTWDVRAGVDPAAALAPGSVDVLAEQFSGGLSFLLGFIAKADNREPAVVEVAGTPYRIVLGEQVAFTTDPAEATATFTGPLEAALRLLTGRLTERYTPEGVEVTGNVGLDDLRGVFPGF